MFTTPFTAVIRVRYKAISCGVCCGRNAAGQAFLPLHGFPVSASFHQYFTLISHLHVSLTRNKSGRSVAVSQKEFFVVNRTALARKENFALDGTNAYFLRHCCVLCGTDPGIAGSQQKESRPKSKIVSSLLGTSPVYEPRSGAYGETVADAFCFLML
jgi:hypothetical protein